MERLKGLITYIFICVTSFAATAQSIHFPFDKNEFQEIVTVYVNDNRFIPGERILFKIDNRLLSGQSSFVSKVAYVELIDSSRQSVLKSKIKLVNGFAQGHLYLPSYLRTGSYTMIAYTAWMLNYSESFIAQVGIQIINPFNPIPRSLLSDSVSIAFFPEGNSYVLNRTNRVAYRLSAKKPLTKLDVKILSSGGGELGAFTHTGLSPYGHFNFEPGQAGEYKVIITDEKQNVYYSLLDVDANSALGISVGESERFNTISCFNRSKEPKLIKLASWRRPDIQKSMLIGSDTILSINKSEWPKGLVYVYYVGTTTGSFIRIENEIAKQAISMRTNKSQYRKREEVQLDIVSDLDISNLSLSVRKVYDPSFEGVYSSDLEDQIANHYFESKEQILDFLITMSTSIPFVHHDSIFILPDYRGQLLYGELGDQTSFTGDGLVTLTTIDENPFIRTSIADKQGSFIVLAPEQYDAKNLVLFNYNGNKAAVHERFLNGYSFVKTDYVFERTNLDPWLQGKSVDVQIENNYYKFKEDVPKNKLPINFLANRIDKTYDFDAYTRFPTIKDVIVEIIPELKLKERNGRIALTMPYIENASSTIDSVLILVDGIPIRTNDFINMNPAQLKEVDLVFDQLRLGNAEYRGVAMFSSLNKDGSLHNNLPGYSNVDIIPFQGPVKYYEPNYNSEQSTMPDHRNQLMWETGFDISIKDTLRFYTSDLIGTFEIIVQGRDDAGNYVLGKSTFEVVK